MSASAGDKADHAGGLDAQSAKARLVGHLRVVEGDPHLGESEVHHRFASVFESPEAPALVDSIIELHGVQLRLFENTLRFQLDFGADQIPLFLEHSSRQEVMRRFERIAGWMARVNTQNHDGVILTSALIRFMAQPGDFDAMLSELDRLREETRSGRFRKDNHVQRDLEFRRFVSEHTKRMGPADLRELYGAFGELEDLARPTEEAYELSDRELVEVKRTAYEATGFLFFLRRLRAQTGRPIVVVGNHRYGRHWVVEPLEDYLRDGFTVRYYRVPSHESMRLTVPHYLERQIVSGFPPEFVREINAEMPHVVIVDVCSPSRTEGVSKFSRALRDYVNWFMAFNDIRAEGDESRYAADSATPPSHLAELKKWYEFVLVRRQLREWVTPGPTYKVAHWAPELKETVLMGDATVPRREPTPGDGKPLVVLANPAIYRSEGDDLPAVLRETEPYYFNDPEKHVPDSSIVGFGSHGLETRVVGPATDQFVAAVQRHIKAEVGRLLESGELDARYHSGVAAPHETVS